MTSTDTTPQKPTLAAPLSTSQPDLDFASGSWAKLRVRPADFARMTQVSRQAVSTWVKKGIVTIGTDGRLDPTESARRVLAQANPGRLRARIFRDLAKPVAEHVTRVRELEAEIADLRAELDALREHRLQLIHPDDQAFKLFALQQRICASIDDLVAARAEGMLSDYVDVMVDEVFCPDRAFIDEQEFDEMP